MLELNWINDTYIDEITKPAVFRSILLHSQEYCSLLNRGATTYTSWGRGRGGMAGTCSPSPTGRQKYYKTIILYSIQIYDMYVWYNLNSKNFLLGL